MEKTIVICMGSSCFSRGNRENVELIKTYIREHGLQSEVTLSGSLCEENCGEGPVVTINGKRFTRVEKSLLLEILNRELKSE